MHIFVRSIASAASGESGGSPLLPTSGRAGLRTLVYEPCAASAFTDFFANGTSAIRTRLHDLRENSMLLRHALVPRLSQPHGEEADVDAEAVRMMSRLARRPLEARPTSAVVCGPPSGAWTPGREQAQGLVRLGHVLAAERVSERGSPRPPCLVVLVSLAHCRRGDAVARRENSLVAQVSCRRRPWRPSQAASGSE